MMSCLWYILSIDVIEFKLLLFFFFSVRTLRLICACAEDYSCLTEVESTPRAAAMWVNQLQKVSTLWFSYHWECSEKLHFSSSTFYWRQSSVSLSSPVTQTWVCRRSASVAVCSGLISPPLTPTQQGLPWVACPPVERLFPVRRKSGSSCLGFGTVPGPRTRGLRKSTKELNLLGDRACPMFGGF